MVVAAAGWQLSMVGCVGNEICDNGAKMLAEALPQSLTTLDLGGTSGKRIDPERGSCGEGE